MAVLGDSGFPFIDPFGKALQPSSWWPSTSHQPTQQKSERTFRFRNARYSDVLSKLFEESGLIPAAGESVPTLTWTSNAYTALDVLDTAGPRWQRSNMCPGKGFWGKKSTSAKVFFHFGQKFGNETVAFMPLTLDLEREAHTVREILRKRTAVILKADNIHRGEGLQIVRTAAELRAAMETGVVEPFGRRNRVEFKTAQPMIRPYLVHPAYCGEEENGEMILREKKAQTAGARRRVRRNGPDGDGSTQAGVMCGQRYKFKVRFFAVVTSIRPLRMYVHHSSALALLCSEPYDADDMSNVRATVCNRVELRGARDWPEGTNESLRASFPKRDSPFVRLFADLLPELGEEKWELVRSRMEDAVVRVVLAGLAVAVQPFTMGLSYWDSGYCFQLLGYDFQVDEDLNVFLLEVNTSPALDIPLPVLAVKKSMLKDLLCLIGEADGCERPAGSKQEIFVRERANI